MDFELMLEEARLDRHGNSRNVATPWEAGWRREVYEQVVAPFWGYLAKQKHITRPDGSLDGRAVIDRLVDAADHYAGRHLPAVLQEQFLNGMGFRFDELPERIEEDCRCPWCMFLGQRALMLGIVPRDERVHEQFLVAFVAHIELVLKAPNAYDHQQGAPRLSWRRARAA